MQIRQRLYPYSTNAQVTTAKHQSAICLASFGCITGAGINPKVDNIHDTERSRKQKANLPGLNTAAGESFGSYRKHRPESIARTNPLGGC